MGHPSPQAAAHALVNQSAFWNEARSGYRVIFLRLSEKHQNMHNFGGKRRKLGMAHNQLGEKISVF